ncbi:amidase [Alloyangia pacifica]|uniref:Aspartyl-tRNA(Asn)/glutamyl-tRNA(Gln) amidotransferase subunit A n=1 Tax=Alloyangia pacifica TaxID=311180 RepID=A0A1I6VVS7_9RHOB|nr:amidase [Alloyangia pacifica]SDI24139.1 aspartyl-tRNA(Asn)/glutamyl-tRNA(Gln) amidotransferase subunit A [Alloyangia pacifica]SFT17691.1 aspartyl-tRNA(Asn)/glutamyl-tRNA(Gln) amidotransferase subunit A [Alloyangia pacifica]
MAVDLARQALGALGPVVELGAVELRDRLASGALSALALAEACIARIEARDAEIRAWAWFDADFVRAQARHLDAHRASGKPIGPLHGLPVGVKDIIDTARIPTENGSAVDAGRVPLQDAFVVERLRQAGAVVMGKTVTTELAFMDPAVTRNPHNPGHTPGGSSSGSAAAVADGMVPLAIGTQTGGSVIRPASFCGVTGFKPSFGAIPRRGVLRQSQSLDTVGVFARDPAGAAMLAETLYGFDPSDPATALAPPPRLLETALSTPPFAPVFALVKPPGWDQADPQLHAGFAELAAALGDQVFEVSLPEAFEVAAAQRKCVNLAEMSRNLHRYGRDGAELLGARTREALAEGDEIRARDYLAALDWRGVLTAGLAAVFERCDAILCPAAPGPAPEGLSSTGDPVFNGLWTFCGTPAVTVPLLTAENGMPMGVQLVAAPGNDARLMRSACWLYAWADR